MTSVSRGLRFQDGKPIPSTRSLGIYRLTHLGLDAGRGAARGGADLRGLAQHLLLLQGHAVLAGGVAVLLVVEDGIGVVNQQLVLLGRREQLSGTTQEQFQHHGASQSTS